MKKNKKPNSWVITVAITTFVLSLFFSYVSNTAISNLKVLPGIVILIFVIFFLQTSKKIYLGVFKSKIN